MIYEFSERYQCPECRKVIQKDHASLSSVPRTIEFCRQRGCIGYIKNYRKVSVRRTIYNRGKWFRLTRRTKWAAIGIEDED